MYEVNVGKRITYEERKKKLNPRPRWAIAAEYHTTLGVTPVS